MRSKMFGNPPRNVSLSCTDIWETRSGASLAVSDKRKSILSNRCSLKLGLEVASQYLKTSSKNSQLFRLTSIHVVQKEIKEMLPLQEASSQRVDAKLSKKLLFNKSRVTNRQRQSQMSVNKWSNSSIMMTITRPWTRNVATSAGSMMRISTRNRLIFTTGKSARCCRRVGSASKSSRSEV